MDYKYDAFISYNHNPRDIRISKMLQQKLEQYKIPEGVSARTGKKKIERVFLDRGELEVAGDLNEEILRALRSTDFLIVICSPESYASPWVKKEIDYFLQYKTKDNILTVLTAGEPYDVLPDVLLYREVTAEDGTVTREAAEPLSCDYRLPEKEANKTELPRLVSALIGCRYDDLVQRRKQYQQKIRTRIAAGAAALMTLASGYMIWSNHRLKASYDTTLIEQSRSLTMQSEEALAQGDRIAAAEYALEALPSAEKPRPLVTDAVLALSNALHLYHSPHTVFTESAVRHFKAVVEGKEMTNALIDAFDTYSDDDLSYLAAIYSNNSICFWDRETGDQILTEYTDSLHRDGIKVLYAVIAPDGRVLIITDQKICCLDVSSGKDVWTMDINGDTMLFSIEPSLEGGVLWVSLPDYQPDARYTIAGIDIENGEVICEQNFEEMPCLIQASPDGKSAVCSFYVWAEDEEDDSSEDGSDSLQDDYERLCVIGPGKDEVHEIAKLPHITDLAFDQDGHLIVASQDRQPENGISESRGFRYKSGGTTIVGSSGETKTFFITCLDPADGRTIWQNELSGIFKSHPVISDANAPEAREGMTACTLGSMLIYFDSEGNKVDSVDFGSNIAAFYKWGANEESLLAVLMDGSRVEWSAAEGTINILYNLFLAPVDAAIADDESIFLVYSETTSDNDHIIEYHFHSPDEKWEEYDSPEIPDGWELESESNVAPYEQGCAEIRHYVSDPDGNTVNSKGGSRIFRVTPRDDPSGKITKQDILIEDPDEYVHYIYRGNAGDKLYFACEDFEGSVYIATADLSTGKTEEIKLAEVLGSSRTMPYGITEAGGQAKISILMLPGYSEEDNLMKVLSIDPESSETELAEIRSLSEEELTYLTGLDVVSPYFDRDSNSVWVYTGSEKVYEYDISSGEELSSIDIGKGDLMGLTVCDDGSLIVLESYNYGSRMHVYDRKTQEKKHTIVMEDVELYDRTMQSAILPDGNILLSTGDDDAFVVDPSDYSILSKIYDFKGYNNNTGNIYLDGGYSGDYQHFGHVPYRTLDEMILEGMTFTGKNKTE